LPEFLAPGVYVEENSFGPRPIEGVSTNTVALIGLADSGPAEPTLVTSVREFSEQFAGFPSGGNLAHAVRGFFANGGTRCFILRLASPVDGSPPNDCVEALSPLTEIDEVSIICCPDEHAIPGMAEALIAHCEQMRYRIAVLAAPASSDLNNLPPKALQSSRAAYYAPWVKVAGDTGDEPVTVHPGGHITGAIAQNDVQRGVAKAPANIALQGIVGLERNFTDREQEPLNQRGINLLRHFPDRGDRIWGARTTSPDPEWKYINIRRYFIYVEKSIEQGTQWVVFEPNGDQLWGNVKRAVEDFLYNEWVNGALLGDKPENAFFVRCDRTTMTQDDIDNGRLICLVGVAAIKPAEFIIFRIGQWTADAQPCP
jgi:phage tail sheath protein FI